MPAPPRMLAAILRERNGAERLGGHVRSRGFSAT